MGDLALGWGILKEQSSQALGWLLWGLGGGRTQADQGTPAGKDGLTPRTFEPVCRGPGAHHTSTVQQAGLQSHLLPGSLLGCQELPWARLSMLTGSGRAAVLGDLHSATVCSALSPSWNTSRAPGGILCCRSHHYHVWVLSGDLIPWSHTHAERWF